MTFLLTVAAIWAIAAVTPGPNFLVVVRCALSENRAVALASVGGTISGTLVWGLAGWLGITALFVAAPAAFIALKLIGGAYLIWLGLRLLWQLRRDQKDLAFAPANQARMSQVEAFRLGLLTNLANPKSAIFVASIFAAALPDDYHWAYGLSAVALMMGISAIWYMALAVFLTNPAMSAGYLRARRLINALTGAVFVGFGAKLMISQR